MAKKVTTTEANRVRMFLDPVTSLNGTKLLNAEGDLENPTLGLEFENEIKAQNITGRIKEYGFTPYDDWKYHNENSLRYHGFEYVSRPTRYYECENIIRELFQSLKKDGCNPKHFTNSLRTSFHVHFNQTPTTLYQTLLFASVYYMFEPLLQDFCGKHRQNNLFCLRLEDTRSVANNLSEVLTGVRNFNNALLASSEFRYGSVSFNSLYKFGTLEFRMMRASSSPDDLTLWYVALTRIRKFALSCGSFEKLRETIACTPMKKFIVDVLGDYICNELDDYLNSFSSKEEAVRSGYVNVLPILVAGCGYTAENTLEIKGRMEAEQQAFKNKLAEAYKGNIGTGFSELDQVDLAKIVLTKYTGGPF